MPNLYPTLQPYKDLIESYMTTFDYTIKDTGYGWRWIFQNGMWFDLIDYKSEHIFLRVGRGAWLVEQYPLLYGMFDTVKKVIATFEIYGPETLEEKWFSALLQLLSENRYEK